MFKAALARRVLRLRPRPIASGQQIRHIKDYDKVVKLLPKPIAYDHNDDRFLSGPEPGETPYTKLTDDEVYELSRVKLEKDIDDRFGPHIDANEAPYDEALAGNDYKKQYTGVERVDQSYWFWVERLLPRRTLPDDQLEHDVDRQTELSSGWTPQPRVKPDLSYFVARTRGKLLPVYRRYQIEGRNWGEYWKNPWDNKYNKYTARDVMKRFWQIEEEHTKRSEGRTMTLTLVTQIAGDIWQFEEDLRADLEAAHKRRILSAVSEVNAVLRLKGDYVHDCVAWLSKKGF